jgi:anion-transporting  ArsA/GET3 family ATPase
MIGKLYHELERRPPGRPPWDLVIFDGPASGQALDLLRMPLTAEETFGASVVGREARNVAAFLRDRERCAMLQVTIGEALAMSETLEFHAALSGIGMAPAAVIFNRRLSLPFGRTAIEQLARLIADGNGGEDSPFIRRANRLLIASRRNDEALRTLQDASGSLIELADHPEVHGRPLVELIAAEIAQLSSGIERRRTAHAPS